MVSAKHLASLTMQVLNHVPQLIFWQVAIAIYADPTTTIVVLTEIQKASLAQLVHLTGILLAMMIFTVFLAAFIVMCLDELAAHGYRNYFDESLQQAIKSSIGCKESHAHIELRQIRLSLGTQ
ncbi:hypothetical protein NT239_01830 [Chitinibacter sp. SCUT-21]|uniref:hypothetical protein n=1 Tax=Chitinibacter sp. SCUT-21 TaxID=2970891 RepID=UPI0035A5A085